MKLFKIFGATLATALFLAGCGGGGSLTGGACTGASCTGGGGSAVAAINVAAGTASVAADGTTSSAITATVLDAKNVAIKGVTVTFAATAGSVLQVTLATTDGSGHATATLTAAGAAAGTNITVSAAAGGVQGQTTVAVIAIQQSLSIATDLPQIPSSGATPANISALLRDANNNALTGITVQFSATSGVLTVTQAVTDVNGVAKATLTAGADPTDRTITVTATAGSASATLPVTVSGTTLALSGPANLVQGNSGTFTIVLTNSAGQGIANKPVTVTSASGNTLSAPVVTTDGTGHVSFNVTAFVGGNDTITAVSLGLTKTARVAVSTQSFTITAPADQTNVTLGSLQTVTVTWLNGSVPVVGASVTFAATRGTVAPTTPVATDVSGQASIQISATGAGPSIVSATGAGVSAQLNLNFVALTPTQISVQTSPAAVAVQGQSTITALVRDATNNLVQGATVNFNVTADPTNGGLSVPSAVSDSQGRAQTVYTAGNSSSGANGVTIAASIATNSSINASTNLTVGGQTVFLSLGTGNTIDTSQGVAIYQITYTVLAVDSQGAALQGVPVTAAVLPVAYGKGMMGNCPTPGPWQPIYSTAANDLRAYNGTTFCQNEDRDYTGNIASLDVAPLPPPCTDLATNPSSQFTNHQKDYNCNGQLDPGNVAVVSPASGTTDANGRLDVKVTYPRDHAYWVWVKLVASTKVQGTQSSTTSSFVLPGAVPDYICSNAPPGPVSPYGTAATCADPR